MRAGVVLALDQRGGVGQDPVDVGVNRLKNTGTVLQLRDLVTRSQIICLLTFLLMKSRNEFNQSSISK